MNAKMMELVAALLSLHIRAKSPVADTCWIFHRAVLRKEWFLTNRYTQSEIAQVDLEAVLLNEIVDDHAEIGVNMQFIY